MSSDRSVLSFLRTVSRSRSRDRRSVVARRRQFLARVQVEQLEPRNLLVVIYPIQWGSSAVSPSDVFRVGELLDTTSLAPGRYPFSLRITEHHTSPPNVNDNATGHQLPRTVKAFRSSGEFSENSWPAFGRPSRFSFC